MSTGGNSPWRALLHLVRPQGGRYALLSLALLVGVVPMLGAPLVIRRILDDTIGAEMTTGEAAAGVDRIRQLGLLVLVLAVAGQALKVFTTWVATTGAWATANDLRVTLTDHVLGLDHEFHRSHTPGALIQRIDGDVTSVSDFLGRVVVTVGSALLMLTGVLVVLIAVNPWMGLGATAYIGLIGLVLSLMRDRAIDEAETTMSTKARLYGGIEERLTAAEDLRANGAGSHAISQFVNDANGHIDARLDEERSFLSMWMALQLSIATGIALSIAAGGWMVNRGVTTVGTAFLLFQYTVWMRRPIMDIVDNLDMVQKASGAMVRVDKLLAERPAIADEGRISPPAGPLSVTFDRVDFSYGDDEPVLTDVSVTIAAGRSVGVVGRTGSGKTTLSRLVLRLVEATGGEVRLGGVPIADIPQAELRQRVAMIPQDVQLMRGTVRDNLTLFDPTVPDADAIDALAQVGLPLDLDARVGVDIGLSAGESQLLALARVWLRRPDLVVLDEATARIDPATEADLQIAISRLLNGRTALIIAHRLSTLGQVDEIVVVDGGRIIEHGDRIVLEAEPGGRYRRLLDLALADVDVDDNVDVYDVIDEGVDGEQPAAPTGVAS